MIFRFDPWLAVFACVVSLMHVLARSYILTHSIQGIVGTPEALAKSVLLFIAVTLALYVIGCFAFYFWDKRTSYNSDSTHLKAILSKYSNRQLFFAFAVLIFIAWLPWICVHFPGTMRDDTIPQYLQSSGIIGWYTQHPILDSLVFGIFWELGKNLGSLATGLFIFILTQAVVTAFCFSFALIYMHKNRVPWGLIFAALIFYMFSRVIYQPIDTMSKDALNGCLFVIVAIQLFEMARTSGDSLKNPRFFACFCITAVLCIATKRTMMYLILAFMIILIVRQIILKRNVLQSVIATVLPILLFTCLWTPLSVSTLQAKENKTYEMYSVPIQQVTRTLREHPEALSQTSAKKLETFMNYSKAQQVYNPVRSDEVTRLINPNGKTSDFMSIWVELGIQHPDSYLAAFMDQTASWYSLTSAIDYGHNMEEELLNKGRMHFWSNAFFDGNMQEAENTLNQLRTTPSPIQQSTYEVVERIDATQRAISPLCSYGTYCFALPLLVLAYCLSRKDRLLFLLLLVPIILLCSFLVGPIALYWYTIPMVYIAPLICSLPYIAQKSQARLLHSD